MRAQQPADSNNLTAERVQNPSEAKQSTCSCDCRAALIKCRQDLVKSEKTRAQQAQSITQLTQAVAHWKDLATSTNLETNIVSHTPPEKQNLTPKGYRGPTSGFNAESPVSAGWQQGPFCGSVVDDDAVGLDLELWACEPSSSAVTESKLAPKTQPAPNVLTRFRRTTSLATLQQPALSPSQTTSPRPLRRQPEGQNSAESSMCSIAHHSRGAHGGSGSAEAIAAGSGAASAPRHQHRWGRSVSLTGAAPPGDTRGGTAAGRAADGGGEGQLYALDERPSHANDDSFASGGGSRSSWRGRRGGGGGGQQRAGGTPREASSPALLGRRTSAAATNRGGGRGSVLFSPRGPSAKWWWWQPDARECGACDTRFRFLLERRHHCRQCGGAFCGSCSDSTKLLRLPRTRYLTRQRVCHACAALEDITVPLPYSSSPSAGPAAAAPAKGAAAAANTDKPATGAVAIRRRRGRASSSCSSPRLGGGARPLPYSSAAATDAAGQLRA